MVVGGDGTMMNRSVRSPAYQMRYGTESAGARIAAITRHSALG